MADALLTGLGLAFRPSGAPSHNNFTLNQTTDQWEAIFCQREAATLTQGGIRLGAITGTTPTYKISIQGVDASGNPDGTIKGGGSPVSKTFSPSGLGWSAGSWHWLTFDNSYACSRGEMLALVVAYSSGTVDASNNASFSSDLNGVNSTNLPYLIQNDAGSRSRRAATFPFGVASASKAYGFPVSTWSNQAFNSGTTPDEYALKFTLPSTWASTFTLCGARVYGRSAAGGSIKLNLYDTDGTTVIDTITFDGDAISQTSHERELEWFFTDATLATLTLGSTYRLGVQPQNANNFTISYLDVSAASDWDAYPLGQQIAATSSRTDAGAWTDTTTRRIMVELLVSDLTAPSGGGGVILGGMNGGLRG